MKREIDLKYYLPPFMVEYKELQRILETENRELNSIESSHWASIDNRFIKTCNEEGIARYEQMLNLIPSENDALNDRIQRVLAKWNRMLPYNYKYLVDQLESLCGTDGYTLDMSKIGSYEIGIKIALESKNLYNDTIKMIHEVIPVNMLVDIALMYNTHEFLHKYPHFVLAQFTHWELKNTAIDKELSCKCSDMVSFSCDEMLKTNYTCDALVEFGIRKR